jgi:hypothetical protein
MWGKSSSTAFATHGGSDGKAAISIICQPSSGNTAGKQSQEYNAHKPIHFSIGNCHAKVRTEFWRSLKNLALLLYNIPYRHPINSQIEPAIISCVCIFTTPLSLRNRAHEKQRIVQIECGRIE